MAALKSTAVSLQSTGRRFSSGHFSGRFSGAHLVGVLEHSVGPDRRGLGHRHLPGGGGHVLAADSCWRTRVGGHVFGSGYCWRTRVWRARVWQWSWGWRTRVGGQRASGGGASGVTGGHRLRRVLVTQLPQRRLSQRRAPAAPALLVGPAVTLALVLGTADKGAAARETASSFRRGWKETACEVEWTAVAASLLGGGGLVSQAGQRQGQGPRAKGQGQRALAPSSSRLWSLGRHRWWSKRWRTAQLKRQHTRWRRRRN